MADAKPSATSDFSGFLDGYQARNMATIERGAALQVSELHTRLSLLRTAAEKNQAAVEIVPLVQAAENKFLDGSSTIVVRLVDVAGAVQEILTRFPKVALEQPGLAEQLRWIVRRYVEAAEISNNDTLLSSAAQLAQAFTAAK